jgi:hypothetical protein
MMIKVTSSLLAFLWFYAAVSKLIDFEKFEISMHKQPVWPVIQFLLIYSLPPAEIATGILLLFKKTVKAGLVISFVLFAVFTVYIILILSRFYGQVPCSCGGVIQHMGWKFHLFFNIFFLALTITSISIIKRKEAGDIH